MTSREAIEGALRSAYKARISGDLEGSIAPFAEDIVFEFNGRGMDAPGWVGPIKGKAAVRPVIQTLIDNFRFSDWQEVSLIVDGEKVVLHWRATITAKNGKAATFDVFDLFTFRDGKIAAFLQTTDTAMIKWLIAD